MDLGLASPQNCVAQSLKGVYQTEQGREEAKLTSYWFLFWVSLGWT